MGPRPRPRFVLAVGVLILTIYLLGFKSSGDGYHVVPWSRDQKPDRPRSEQEAERERAREQREKHEQALRDEFAYEYERAKR